ncbi:MAG: hypothetical protein ACYTFE_01865 [Planctomycetota bacterium]|jgi:hypothetical protein
MKKLILVLALLLIAAPAWSAVTLDLEEWGGWYEEGTGFNEGVILYDVNGENVPRAWALEVTLDNEEAWIDGVWRDGDGAWAYWVSPGNASVADGEVDGGDPAVEQEGAYALIEMASLYAEGEDPPPDACDLFAISIGGPPGELVCMDITVEPIRGGVIDEAGASLDIDPNDPLCMVLAVNPDPNAGTCWDPADCNGQPGGDATCDGSVNLDDLRALKDAWLESKGDPAYDCCADFTQDEVVNLDDLRALKDGWLNTGLTPAIANLNCPE